MDFVMGDNSGPLGRVVSMSSFVLEKMYLDEGIAGSKKVNIVLHLLNGGLVMWLLWLLFRFQDFPAYRGLAVLSGAIWLLHPLFVSTVLYVVQRMAMITTFFMLLSALAYVYWRLSLCEGKGGWLRFLPVPALFLTAMFAKENAIVLVPVLLVLEVLWFDSAGPDGRRIPWLRNLSCGLIIGGATVVSAIAIFGYDRLAARFVRRPFSLDERLLSQARIVWDYVGQWFYPQVSRMGIYHDDFVWSRSLSEPGITQTAVLGWVLVLLVCALLLRRPGGRLVALGIAWFLLGHSVESTVLPLEMVFEHRNYFPAIGLMLSIGALVGLLLKRWPETAPPLLAMFTLLAVVLAGLTSSQVQLWSNRSLLLLSQLNGHPDSARANTDMAVELASRGLGEAARRYSKKAFESSSFERVGDYQVRDLALTCLAGEPVPVQMIEDLGAAEPDRPLGSVTTLLAMVRMVQDGRCPQLDRIRFADRLAEIYLVEDYNRRGSANIYSNLAVLENALQRYDNAYAYAERFLSLSNNNKRGLLMKLHFATATGRKEASQEVIAILQDMDRRGQLTVGEQQTLALYLEK
jgi:hypothetical protein